MNSCEVKKKGYRFTLYQSPMIIHKKTMKRLKKDGKISLRDLLNGHLFSERWNTMILRDPTKFCLDECKK